MQTCTYCGNVFGAHEVIITDYDTTCLGCQQQFKKMETEALKLNLSDVLKELSFELEEESEK